MFSRTSTVRFLSVMVVMLFVSQIFFTEMAFSKYYIQQEADFQKAKDLFSQGEYENVINILQKLIDASLLKQEEQKIEAFELLFHSYYNLGRKSEAGNTVRKLLKLKPNHELDSTYVPPEKIKFFEKIKTELVHLTIHSIPSNLNVYIDGELQKGKMTPNRYTVFDGRHHITVASPDETRFKSWEDRILFDAGKDQTLNVELIKINKPKKPVYKKPWFLAIIGGATVAIAYILFHPNKEKKEIDLTLPVPPDRPSN